MQVGEPCAHGPQCAKELRLVAAVLAVRELEPGELEEERCVGLRGQRQRLVRPHRELASARGLFKLLRDTDGTLDDGSEEENGRKSRQRCLGKRPINGRRTRRDPPSRPRAGRRISAQIRRPMGAIRVSSRPL